MSPGVQIGRLARETGLSVDAIRFYEKQGLLREPPRSQGGFRQYSQRDVDRLRFIRSAQELGFSLAEVRELQLIGDQDTHACTHVRDLIRKKLDSVLRKMDDLKELERSLKAALGECEQALERGNAEAPGSCPVLGEFTQTCNKRKRHQ